MAKETRRERDLRLLKAKVEAAKKKIAEEKRNRSYFDIRNLKGTLGQPEQDAVRSGQIHTPKPGTVAGQKSALKKAGKVAAEVAKEKLTPVTKLPLADSILGDIRLFKKYFGGKDKAPKKKPLVSPPKPAKAPAKAEPVKAKAPAKAEPKARVPDDPKTRSALESFVDQSGDVATKAKAPAKEAPKAKAKAQAKSAPKLPKNWRSLKPDHPDRVAFRAWYKKNRPSAPKTAVAKAAATKKAVPKPTPKTAAPARTADLTALQTRIKMKRKSGQAIPASWLKAEKAAKAKARAAKVAQSSKKISSSIDRLENQKEAASGRADMAKWKAGAADVKAKHRARMSKMVADAKAQASDQNKKYREDKARAAQAAEAKGKIEAIKKRKADAQARLAKMKADREEQQRKSRQADLQGLRFRR